MVIIYRVRSLYVYDLARIFRIHVYLYIFVCPSLISPYLLFYLPLYCEAISGSQSSWTVGIEMYAISSVLIIFKPFHRQTVIDIENNEKYAIKFPHGLRERLRGNIYIRKGWLIRLSPHCAHFVDSFGGKAKNGNLKIAATAQVGHDSVTEIINGVATFTFASSRLYILPRIFFFLFTLGEKSISR